ncbi:short-chain dehydrogenase [Brevibacillus choshinensis]|uniref:Short-chain dehydrogenase n=1 Tax=Brevibacillus choshinensis TaxID=54911 RepID=A0ABX7FUQ8_BRECH|nr:short-chain dehydrogenase [Brevibacillus choshinensis]QRG69449.1 short-chain dehydrogenase [Brevibacillus choshinensis]
MGREALVVGGSGMLADATIWLAREGYHVSVVGRDRGRLERVANDSSTPDRFTLLDLDYQDSTALLQAMARLQSDRGEMDLVVAWIHQTAPEALSIIQRAFSGQEKAWRLYHVCGSRAWIDPPTVQEVPSCLYRRIILGFVPGEPASRWLTNDEIAGGVVQAIKADRPQSIVGSVEPWEKRPGY